MCLKKTLVSLGVIGLTSCCYSQSTYSYLDVSLSLDPQNSSTVSLVFKNKLDIDIHLPVYVFCRNDMLYMDLFDIQKENTNDKKHLGHYGGLTDFVDTEMLDNGEMLTLGPNESKSCNVDIPLFYSFYEKGDYQVTYKLHQNLFDKSTPIVISSNTVTIKIQKDN